MLFIPIISGLVRLPVSDRRIGSVLFEAPNVMVSPAEPRHSVIGPILFEIYRLSLRGTKQSHVWTYSFCTSLSGNLSVVETHNCVSTEVVFERKKAVSVFGSLKTTSYRWAILRLRYKQKEVSAYKTNTSRCTSLKTGNRYDVV